MAGLLLVFVALLGTSQLASAVPVGTCPAQDPLEYTVHLPDSSDCTIFYKCDHGGPVLFHCPDGLHFNPTLSVCDWPQNAGCYGDGGSDGSSSTAPPGTTPCPAIGTCPEYDSPDDIVKLLPHADNCTLYCRCDHGVPITMPCAPGTWFNPVLEVCDWPEDSGCISGGSTTKPPTKSTPTTATSDPPSSPSTAAPLCPAIGTCPEYDSPDDIVKLLPHADNCTLYCRCDHGVPITMPCAPGTWFNPTLEVCDWPENAGCISGGSTTKPPTSGSTNSPSTNPPSSPSTSAPLCPAIGTCPEYDSPDDIVKLLPHADNCTLYCRCDHGVPITMPCAPGTWFNPTLEVCDWPENAGCISGGSTTKPPTSGSTNSPSTNPPSSPSTSAPLCPAIGTCPEYDSPDDIVKLLPHADNCTLYCRCDHGVPITMPCPEGTWFNPLLEICDWPQNSGCISGGSTTQAPSSPSSSSSAPSSSESPSSSTQAPSSSTAAPEGNCDAVGTCPEYDEDSIVVHLPSRTDCTVYCRCDHGVPIKMPCPDGLYFNPKLEVCDWPQNAGCAAENARK